MVYIRGTVNIEQEARAIPRRAAASKKPTRKAFLLYLKLYKQLARGVCIIKERNPESNTVRPGAEPIDRSDRASNKYAA